MTFENVEFEVRKMIAEATSGYNDGWVQEEYRNRLIELKALIEQGLE
jgi:hypothetical protein